jgi:hypothetical protein
MPDVFVPGGGVCGNPGCLPRRIRVFVGKLCHFVRRGYKCRMRNWLYLHCLEHMHAHPLTLRLPRSPRVLTPSEIVVRQFPCA